uniref:RING-type domain-containing protein n=1 Tax=Panagrolaimus superbus TaxID=310955 RepID=A0A914XWZ4_9BILA
MANKESVTENLLQTLSNINYVPLTRQVTSKPYYRRRQVSPKINNDNNNNSITSSFLDEISSINANFSANYSSLLNSFQSFQATSNETSSTLGSSSSSNSPLISVSAAPISIDNLTNILIDIVKPVIPPPRKAFDCLICYTKFYEDEGALACSAPPELETSNENAVKHLICVTCIRGYAHNSIFDGQVAHGGSGLKCVTGECENVLLLSDFEHYLADEDYIPLKTRLQEQCLLDAGLADLVTCPECSYKIIVEESLIFYTCNCGRIQCRNCPRIYDEQHQNKTCEQMAQLELQQASMRRIEPQMSEIMIRKCHRCNLNFVKSHGCNKMTCRCKATQCYLCRQPDIDYNHFCNCGSSARTHGACRVCGKSCRNNENVADLDRQAINRLRNRGNA